MKKIFKIAFSLVELMVTLVVVTVLTAAMAPVITKKLKSKEITIASGGGGEITFQECSDEMSAKGCAFCASEDKCSLCTRACLDNEYTVTEPCECAPCTDVDLNCIECNSRQCRTCNSSYYILSTKCEICPVGSYCNGKVKQICESGKYTDLTGQTSCTTCEAGYYCQNGIKSECEAGTYSANSANSCATCPKGYKCPGLSDKIQCNGNQYQPSTGQDGCLTCNAGYYVSDDRSSCNVCPAGYYCSGNGSKVQCSAGSYAGAGPLSCSNCSSGYYSSAGADSCSACWANSSSSAGSSTCTCNSGYYGSGSCATCASKTTYCTTCDATSGVCTSCSSGYVVKDGICKTKEFTYSYTGTHVKDTLPEYTRIVLKSSGTFTSLSEANGTVMVLGGGGGGGGGGSTAAGPRAGCAGYNNQSELVFTTNASWSVTIGDGGGGGGGNHSQWLSGSGGWGSSSTFGAITGAGGQGGSGWSDNVYNCSGGAAFEFAGISYASGCSQGSNTGTGGCAGGRQGTGGTGSSGVVSIMIPRT